MNLHRPLLDVIVLIPQSVASQLHRDQMCNITNVGGKIHTAIRLLDANARIRTAYYGGDLADAADSAAYISMNTPPGINSKRMFVILTDLRTNSKSLVLEHLSNIHGAFLLLVTTTTDYSQEFVAQITEKMQTYAGVLTIEELSSDQRLPQVTSEWLPKNMHD